MRFKSTVIPALCGLLLTSIAHGAPMYTVTPLGTLGGTRSYAYGINASGRVVGSAYTTLSDMSYHAFLYDGGTMNDLGSLETYYNSVAQSINDSGLVVGRIEKDDTPPRAIVYDGTMHLLLGARVYGSAQGVNARGQIVGDDGQAFCYSESTGIQRPGTLGGTRSYARCLNDNGQFVGFATTSGDAAHHAFLYDSTTGMHDLGTLGGTNSYAFGVNASGQVVGFATTSGDAAQHAFLYDSTTGMHDLGTLGGTNSYASGINASGQVVGRANTSGDTTLHVYLYENGTMHDLNSLLTPGGGWTITQANAINDSGWIAATGHNPAVNGGADQALLLTVVPEPAGLVWLAALAGLGIRRRRNNS